MTNQPGQAPSSRDRMMDAVKAIVQQKVEERQEASEEAAAGRERARRRARRLPLLVLLAIVGLGISVAVNMPRWRHPFSPPTGQAAERDAHSTIRLASTLVERFRATNGRLPQSLEETGVPLPGVVYRADGDGYQLTVMADTTPIVFQRPSRP